MRKSLVPLVLFLAISGGHAHANDGASPAGAVRVVQPITVEQTPAVKQELLPFLEDADADGDRIVTRDEISNYAETFWDRAYENSRWDWANFFRLVDAPVRDVVSRAERFRLMKRFRDRADTDRDGKVSEAEVASYLKMARLPEELLAYGRRFAEDLHDALDGPHAAENFADETLLVPGELFARGSRLREDLADMKVKHWEANAVGGIVKLGDRE